MKKWVNHIKPGSYLTFESYKILFDEGVIQENNKRSEVSHKYKLIEAWCSTIYQIIKLFSLKRVNVKSFKTNPGVITKEIGIFDDKSLSTSNIYSIHENLLLKWYCYHFKKVYPKKYKRLLGFGKELSDSLALSAVLLNHISTLEPLLEGIKLSVISQEDFEHNANLIVNALKEAKIKYELSPQDILHGNPRDLLLFSIFLYNILHQYIPRTKISFEGNLQETTCKSVELTNPTKHLIEYNVVLEPLTTSKNLKKNEFVIEKDFLVLPKKSKVSFPIMVTPKFCTKNEARITFFPKKTGNYRPEVIVFLLQTKVLTNTVFENFKISSNLYEFKQFEIPVRNIFSKNATFKINLTQSFQSKSKRKFLPEPFWITKDHIPIKSNSQSTLVINYLPFESNINYNCKIFFNDPKVGEFIYGIEGKCIKIDNITQTIKFTVDSSHSCKKDILIKSTNSVLDKAITMLKERNKKSRFSKIPFEQIPDFSKITFNVKYSSKYFSGKKKYVLERNNLEKQKLPINFDSRNPGVYNCLIYLDSPLDKRIVRVVATVRSPDVEAELQFTVPVRKKIVQEIPIRNKTDQTWLIQANLKGEFFSGPSELHVTSDRTVSYPLQFYPKSKKTVHGELILNNPSTSEKLVFKLMGNVEEPIAEDRIIIDCKAREKKVYSLKVNKIGVERIRYINYKVECDLHFIKHEKTFLIKERESSGLFELVIFPTFGGSHIGSITFIADNKEQIWFVLEINVERSAPEGEIAINTSVRRKKLREIEINNPTNKEISYHVQIEGDENLSGDTTILLEANKNKKYKLIYQPKKIGKFKGSISFFNDIVGEFWYKLNLTSEEPKPIVLDDIDCELGKEKKTIIRITCPLDYEITFNVETKNKKNFFAPKTLIVSPTVASNLIVTYFPTSINEKETTTIVLKNAQIGNYKYRLTGYGKKPTEMKIIKVSSKQKKPKTSLIIFKNPFPKKTYFIIKLVTESRMKSVFSLVGKKKYERKLSLLPFQQTNIPYSFTPININEYKAKIFLRPENKNFEWEYQILGTTEVVNDDISFNLKCKSRTKITEKIVFPLNGILSKEVTKNSHNFNYELEFPKNKSFEKAIRRSIKVTRQYDQNLNRNPNATFSLLFEIVFGPLRPFDGRVNLVVKSKNSGVWKFPLFLSSSPPDFDDIIEINAVIGKIKRVSFKLSNVFPHTSKFESYFSPETSVDFIVQPEKGVLPPKGYEGTEFIISYEAQSYGKISNGILIVDTDLMQWRYNVKGVLPRKRKKETMSVIDNRLSFEVEKTLKERDKKKKTKKKRKRIRKKSKDNVLRF